MSSTELITFIHLIADILQIQKKPKPKTAMTMSNAKIIGAPDVLCARLNMDFNKPITNEETRNWTALVTSRGRSAFAFCAVVDSIYCS
jgi:hypothetical protein